MFQLNGHTIHAPGFTADQFDRAVKRAHDEGLTVLPCNRPQHVVVPSADGKRAYITSRTSCTCTAGQHGTPCKHIALAVFLIDVQGLDITKPGMPPLVATASRQSA